MPHRIQSIQCLPFSMILLCSILYVTVVHSRRCIPVVGVVGVCRLGWSSLQLADGCPLLNLSYNSQASDGSCAMALHVMCHCMYPTLFKHNFTGLFLGCDMRTVHSLELSWHQPAALIAAGSPYNSDSSTLKGERANAFAELSTQGTANSCAPVQHNCGALQRADPYPTKGILGVSSCGCKVLWTIRS